MLPVLRSLAAACLALAGACSSPPAEVVPAAGPSEVRPQTPVISPSAEDTVVVAVRRLPASLDPFTELDPWGQRVVDDLLFEGLVRRQGDSAPWIEMALADRCEVDHDPAGRGVVCHLREGAQFHDGSAVTREDALLSVNQWLGSRGQGLRQRHGLDGLRAAVPADGPPSGPKDSSGRWLRLVFEHDDPLVLEKIAAIKIVPRGRVAQPDQPIGSGPFRFVAGDDVHLMLERTSKAPGLAGRIVLRAIDDGAAALTALRRAEVHVLAEVAPIHVPKELAKPAMAARFAAYLVSPARFDLLLFNLREGPQSGPRMRAALDLAAPRGELALQVYGLPGLPLTAPVDLHAPAPIDLVALAEGRDAEAGLGPLLARPAATADASGRAAADAILNELGWIHERGLRRRQGVMLRLPLTWDASPGLATGVARALRGAWKLLGVQAPSVTASWPYVQANLLRGGKFSVALARLASGTDVDLYPWFHSRGAHNLTGVADQTLDAAIDTYRAALTRIDRDRAKQAIATRLGELRPAIVLHAPLAVTLLARTLTGVQFVDDLPRLDRLGFAPGRTDDAWIHEP
ncbi:ABC transporter substrate-binding protein [Nannocystis bainbridge]|uniref:ABC transporter substrate-binding protein n=1 Tax=Nannocystis bainbridge TaxID=2995303 RepID=A0ABT5E2R5_9BACT|nr:ABC transporter substrate-binding protein [Nannocystis bainbridge]MDC0720143.1 ABC transporter substrate-binding protein [Nannocystis bainbridge]